MWRQHRFYKPAISGLSLLTICLVVTGLTWFACYHPMFSFQDVTLEEGSDQRLKHVDSNALAREVMPLIQGNFFTSNLDSIRDLVQTISWVRRAQVRREWPNKLFVDIEEYDALGVWREEGQLLSTKGDIFTANFGEAEDEAGELPVFSGPDGSQQEVIKRYHAWQTVFKQLGAALVSVRVSPRQSWSVKLDSGMTIELGRDVAPMDVDKRLNRFIAVYPKIMTQFPIKIDSVDLRYPVGLTIKGVAAASRIDPIKK